MKKGTLRKCSFGLVLKTGLHEHIRNSSEKMAGKEANSWDTVKKHTLLFPLELCLTAGVKFCAIKIIAHQQSSKTYAGSFHEA